MFKITEDIFHIKVLWEKDKLRLWKVIWGPKFRLKRRTRIQAYKAWEKLLSGQDCRALLG